MMDIKYYWTHKRGVTQRIANELYSYKEDTTAYTPVIDQYFLQKNRETKEEQIKRIERVIAFEVSAVIMIEKLIGGIQDATEEELETISQQIETIEAIETIDDFMVLIAGEKN